MINDKTLQFSADQALTATAASTDYLDLGSDRDIGPGTPLWLVVVSKVAAGGTSPTIAISIESDDNASFSSPATLAATGTIAGASFGAGAIQVLPWPFTNERYNRVKYTLAGTSPTFTVDAWLTSQPPPNWQPMADGLEAF